MTTTKTTRADTKSATTTADAAMPADTVSLRLTKEAVEAVDDLVAAAGRLFTRHRLMVLAVTHGARMLAADPTALLRRPGVGAPPRDASALPVVDPQEPESATDDGAAKETSRQAVLKRIASVAEKEGGTIVTTAAELAATIGLDSNSVGQFLHLAERSPSDTLRVTKHVPTHKRGVGYRTNWEISAGVTSPSAPVTPARSSVRQQVAELRGVIDHEYDVYLGRVAVVVATKPGRAVEWTGAEMARRVKGCPSDGNRGVGNVLSAMARNSIARGGLRAIKTGEEREGLEVFRLMAAEG